MQIDLHKKKERGEEYNKEDKPESRRKHLGKSYTEIKKWKPLKS